MYTVFLSTNNYNLDTVFLNINNYNHNKVFLYINDYNQNKVFLYIKDLVLNSFESEQQRPRSDCADSLADLCLYYL